MWDTDRQGVVNVLSHWSAQQKQLGGRMDTTPILGQGMHYTTLDKILKTARARKRSPW
jgi:hypothetical protein